MAEAGSSAAPGNGSIRVRVNVPDLRTQKVAVVNLKDTIFTVLQMIMNEVSLVKQCNLFCCSFC